MKKRGLACLAVLLLLVLAAWGLNTIFQEGPSREFTLTDGRVVRLIKVGTGTIKYDSYRPLKAAIADYVPNQFRNRLGPRTQGAFAPQNGEIGLLFEFQKSATKKPDYQQILSRIEFVDSNGFVHSNPVSGYTGNPEYILISEGAYPRRDPELQIRLYEVKTEKLLGEVRVPNPGYKPTFPEWTPDSLPATKTVEPLTVTLKRGLAEIPTKYLRDEDLEITSTDPRWTKTKPAWHFTASDATGNKAWDLSRLSPFEPAWKLAIQVRRSDAAEFGEDEIWRTGFIKLPGELQVDRLKLSGKAAGVELSTAYISSAGEVRDFGNELKVIPVPFASKTGTSTSSGSDEKRRRYSAHASGQPFLLLNFTAIDAETSLIVRVADQAGRNLVPNDRGRSYNTSGGISSKIVQFEPHAETTEVQLEVIVNKARTIEFFVAPPKPKSDQAANVGRKSE